MGAIPAAIVLVVTTIVIAVCADYLVGSIDNVVETAKISKTFVGLILIPIVGNAAEHVTAVVVAVKNKMDLVSLEVGGGAVMEREANGDRLWVSLSAPASRLRFSSRPSWSWSAGPSGSPCRSTSRPVSRAQLSSSVPCANPFQVSTVAFAFSVMVVTYTVQDGRSNYLEGAMVSPPALPSALKTGQLIRQF